MRRWHILLTLCAVTVLGCGRRGIETFPVSGKVSFLDGRPLAGGTIEFQPASAPEAGKLPVTARGAIQPDGTFRLSTFEPEDGAVAGEHRVLITQPIPPGRINPMNPTPTVINTKYQSYATSGLSFAVTAEGPNEFSVTVTPPGK